MGIVSKMLDESSYWGKPHFCFWMKPNASNAGGYRYVSAVETFLICYKSSCAGINQYWNFDTSPTDRLNFVQMDSISKTERVLKPNGKAFQCQKPVALLASIFAHHCPPGSTILDLGTGSGSAEIAALASGCNVVGLEMHKKTFALTKKRIVASFDLFEESGVYFDDPLIEGSEYSDGEVGESAETTHLGAGGGDEELETDVEEYDGACTPSSPPPTFNCCVCMKMMDESSDFGACLVCSQKMHLSCTAAPDLGDALTQNVICSLTCGED